MRSLIVISAILAMTAANAGPVGPKEICTQQHTVDKQLLKGSILKAAGVSMQSLVWAGSLDNGRPDGMDPATYLIVSGDSACDRFTCEVGDGDALNAAAAVISAFMEDATDDHPVAFELRGPKDRNGVALYREFFQSDSYSIACLTPDVHPEPARISAHDEAHKIVPDIRVRGKAADLYARRNDDYGVFTAADKANLSYNQDDVKHKRVRSASGFLGVGFQLSDKPLFGAEKSQGDVTVVPYLGILSNITKAAGSAASVTSDSRQAGVMFYSFSKQPAVYYWSVRPQLSWDLTDKSRLFTTTLGYTPIVSDLVNVSYELSGPYWIQWIFDARLAHGHYTSLGKRKPDDSRDFDRLGGDAGFELDHDGPSVPWSWKITESYLRGWNGSNRNLSQLKSILSFNLDDKKLFGIDLTYTNGRDPDTTEKDHSWKISLGVKY